MTPDAHVAISSTLTAIALTIGEWLDSPWAWMAIAFVVVGLICAAVVGITWVYCFGREVDE